MKDLLKIIAGAYEENPKCAQDIIKTARYGYAVYLKDAVAPKTLSLASLHKTNNLELAILLANLPQEWVYKTLGESALLWTAIKYPYSRDKNCLYDGVAAFIGKDSQLLQKSQKSIYQLLHDNNPQTIMRVYELLDYTLHKDYGDVQPRFAGYANIETSKLNKYSLQPHTPASDYATSHPKGWNWRMDDRSGFLYDIFLDAPIGLSLMYDGYPAAVASFMPISTKTVLIKQLQGIRPNIVYLDVETNKEKLRSLPMHHLNNIDWKGFYIEEISRLCHEKGFTRIGIQSGHNNKWTREYTDGKVHLPLQDALKRYDVFAQRTGFVQGKDKNWYKNIGRKSYITPAGKQRASLIVSAA